jgi:hypothetical protein
VTRTVKTDRRCGVPLWDRARLHERAAGGEVDGQVQGVAAGEGADDLGGGGAEGAVAGDVVGERRGRDVGAELLARDDLNPEAGPGPGLDLLAGKGGTHGCDREQQEATKKLAELRRRQHELRLASFAAAAVGLLALSVFLLLIIGYQRRLVRQALHDPLTGLPNRELFADRVGQSIRTADRELRPAALLLLDLDRFKETTPSATTMATSFSSRSASLDPSGSIWTDEASNVSRLDPSGAVQVDAEHPSRNRKSSVRIRPRAPKPQVRACSRWSRLRPACLVDHPLCGAWPRRGAPLRYIGVRLAD